MLLHALYERLCTAPLNRLPCYGALEVIVTLLLLLLLKTRSAAAGQSCESGRNRRSELIAGAVGLSRRENDYLTNKMLNGTTYGLLPSV